MKFLLWALVIYLGWRWFTAQKKSVADQTAPADNGAEKMVQCAHCGIHLPASEAISGPDSTIFCSQEHSLMHRAS
jgi:uncharacterized protein